MAVKQNDKYPDEKIITIITDYLKETEWDGTPVVNQLSPEKLKKKIDLTLNPKGCTLDELYQFIDSYLKYSVRTGHKQFFNQFWSGFTLPGFLGDLFTSLTNTSMYTYEAAPVATLIETFLIQKMGALIGYSSPDGLFGTGGSNGNLMGMMIARNRMYPDLKKKGVQSGQNCVAFVSDQAHYSFDKAANILGIGTDQVIKVTSDEQGRMIPEELDRMIRKTKESGRTPFFIAATAGTTVKGAFDPCDKISKIAQQYKIWFHVDGSLGGSVLLSPKHRHMLKGCEGSDSFVWNPHKMMGLPLICSAFIVKKKGNLARAFSTSGADYLFHDASSTYDLGLKSLQCGRKVDALKLWLSWKYYGDEVYAERIDKLFELSAYAEKIINAHPNLELMAYRSSVNICFRYSSPGIHDLNIFNLRLREDLAKRGKSMVNYAHIGKDLAIRFVIFNHESEKEDIDHFFDNVLQTALSLQSKSNI
ncbi:MAG: glutamate decarboxylase [Candidatus Aminicenantes bacterium]|nr:glutamate decarboxylase [Candidatus Aminicenantes bacterium]